MHFGSSIRNTNPWPVPRLCASSSQELQNLSEQQNHPPSCVLLITSMLWTPWSHSPHCSQGLINASICKWAQLPNCCTWFFFFRVICQQCNEAPSWMMKRTEVSLFSLKNLKASYAETLLYNSLDHQKFLIFQLGALFVRVKQVTDTSVALNTQSINQALQIEPVSNQSSRAFGSRWGTRQECLAISKFHFVNKNG